MPDIYITEEALLLIKNTMMQYEKRFGGNAIPSVNIVSYNKRARSAIKYITLGIFLDIDHTKCKKVFFNDMQTEIIDCIPEEALLEQSPHIIYLNAGTLCIRTI